MISVAVLTLNSGPDFIACMESLEWCDDVHVVDSGSVDETIEIAESMGAHVVTHIQGGDRFSLPEQRNWALSNLPFRHAWVLFVDHDERAGAVYAEALREAIREDPDRDAFLTAPKFMYHGRWLKHAKRFPTWEPRLMKHRTVRLKRGFWDVFDDGVDPGRVFEPYEHYANAKGLSDWLAKHARYAEAEAINAVSDQSEDGSSTRRRLAALLGPVRPLLVPLWFLLVRRAFLDGREGLSYVRRMLIYELVIREGALEKAHLARGGSL